MRCLRYAGSLARSVFRRKLLGTFARYPFRPTDRRDVREGFEVAPVQAEGVAGILTPGAPSAAFSLSSDVGQGALNVGDVVVDMIIAEAYGRDGRDGIDARTICCGGRTG
jgi:hypothetical protein